MFKIKHFFIYFYGDKMNEKSTLTLTNKNLLTIYVKCAIVAIATFVICSLCINSTFLWVAYYNKAAFDKFLITRYFVQGQIFVSLLNYAVLFILIPIIRKTPFFKSLEL